MHTFSTKHERGPQPKWERGLPPVGTRRYVVVQFHVSVPCRIPTNIAPFGKHSRYATLASILLLLLLTAFEGCYGMLPAVPHIFNFHPLKLLVRPHGYTGYQQVSKGCVFQIALPAIQPASQQLHVWNAKHALFGLLRLRGCLLGESVDTIRNFSSGNLPGIPAIEFDARLLHFD